MKDRDTCREQQRARLEALLDDAVFLLALWDDVENDADMDDWNERRKAFIDAHS